MSSERRIPLWAYWVGFAFVAMGLIWLLSGALTPFVAAMAIAYLLDPLADKLERLGLSRAAATAVIMVGFFTSAILVLIILIPLIEVQIAAFALSAPDLWRNAQATVLRPWPILSVNKPMVPPPRP
jgi:predicted PurR-regulated permease PerM